MDKDFQKYSKEMKSQLKEIERAHVVPREKRFEQIGTLNGIWKPYRRLTHAEIKWLR